MSKSLLLVRHGKSDWSNFGLKDFDRTLNNRGHENAVEMAHRLRMKNTPIDLMMSSPAKRAKSTAEYFAQAFDFDTIQYEPTIYEARIKDLYQVVNAINNSKQCVILFGHNPALTEFANQLCNGHIYNIPTAGIVSINFPFESWEMISAGTGDLLYFDYPKNSDEI